MPRVPLGKSERWYDRTVDDPVDGVPDQSPGTSGMVSGYQLADRLAPYEVYFDAGGPADDGIDGLLDGGSPTTVFLDDVDGGSP